MGGALRAHRIEKALHCTALGFKEKKRAGIVARNVFKCA